jgi:hypothetical protein
MRGSSGRRKGRRGATCSGVRAQLGVQGVWHRAVPAAQGGARPLERASKRGAALGDGGRDGARRPRRRWVTEAMRPWWGLKAAEVTALTWGRAATDGCRQRKLSPHGMKEELLLLPRA